MIDYSNYDDLQLAQEVLDKESQLLSYYQDDSDISKVIYTVRKNGIELLREFCNCEIPKIAPNEADVKTKLSYEKELCLFYDNITDFIKDDRLKDICFRLWATSENEYQLALENAIPNTNNQIDSINDFLSSAKDIALGKADTKKIQETINNPNFSFFSGLAIGGLVAISIKEIINKKDESCYH